MLSTAYYSINSMGTLEVRSVAVIGAGVSGVSAAIHLTRAGLEVTVFERSSRAGGVWYVTYEPGAVFSLPVL